MFGVIAEAFIGMCLLVILRSFKHILLRRGVIYGRCD